MPLWNRVIRAGSRSLPDGVEPGAAEGDVVGLPLAGRARGVEQGRVLAVDRPGLAVGVGLGLVGVEHLDLELAHQEDAAVAPVLAHARAAGSARPTRRGAGCRRTSPSSRSARPPARSPCNRRPPSTSRRPPLGRLPRVEVRPVEQDDRILRRLRRDRALRRARPPAASGGGCRAASSGPGSSPSRASSAARQASRPEVAIRQARPNRREIEGMGESSGFEGRSEKPGAPSYKVQAGASAPDSAASDEPVVRLARLRS